MVSPVPNELSAAEAARAIASGALTSAALVEACLQRIAAREASVQAWAHLDPDAALAEARARDAEPARGVLHGVPVGFKDIIDTVGLPTEYGSPIYRGHHAAADAACVALVRNAGGVVLGKTVTTEFAFVNPGKTRNPHRPTHSPGGSSSGSAAAVADRMVPLALGTQTGGSVIRPASFCGVVGYKPSIGQLSYAGVKLLARSLDTLGAMARRVEDLALLRAALLGAPAAVAGRGSAPRIGLSRTPWWGRADASSQAALLAAGEALAAAGAAVAEVELPAAFAGLCAANGAIMTFEGSRSLAYEIREHRAELSEKLTERLLPDAEIPYERYREALALAARCAGELPAVLGDLDALLVPSAVGEAPEGFETTGDPRFNQPWTTIGAPCVTLPGHQGSGGLPVGVQLVGRLAEDEALLATAAWAEPRIV